MNFPIIPSTNVKMFRAKWLFAGLKLRFDIRFTNQDFDIFFPSYAEEIANGGLAERIAILLTDAVPKSLLAQRPLISL